MTAPQVDPVENKRRMEAGELYYCFTDDLIAERRRCQEAVAAFNRAAAAGETSRRKVLQLWKNVVDDKSALPPPAATLEGEDELLGDYPWVDGPINKIDYGYNVKLGTNVYVNTNSTWIDTSPIWVGSRTLIGPNCSFYSGTHPLDPFVRNGTRGPESGKPITIGEDCWLGGNVTVLPGVTIGRGSTVGAGSVVTKDVPEFTCVVGNPARILKKIETSNAGAADKEGSGAVQVLAGKNTPAV